MKEQIKGLTAQEVIERIEKGEGSVRTASVTKTYSQILKGNIITLFNLLNFTIAVLLFAVGAYSNMIFFAIILMNIAIGIAQEFKAKKLVDELSILNSPQVTVVREENELLVGQEEIVRDDIVVLESGRQICNDAVVLSGTVEVNESLLTGESDAVIKEEGAELLSGSLVISGRCYARVTHVGSENYATKLAEEVKKEKLAESELLGAMKRVTGLTSFLIIPLGILLFLEATILRNDQLNSAVVSAAAALLGMLPKGLVLLISVSLATGVIRLAKMKILVQNIYSLETLAHVDVLCLDKTGTITDGNMKVHSVMPLTEHLSAERVRLLQSYLRVSEDNNATIQALRKEFKPELFYQPVNTISFSSKRKWGAVSFESEGTVFVGAPERLFGQETEEAERFMESGFRVIAVGYTQTVWKDEEKLPEDIQPLYLIALADTIRKHTRETLQYFYGEGVDVKVISGDHIKTVSMIAKEAGLGRWNDAIDLSELGEDADFQTLCQKYAVFARTTPKQKQKLVQAMKQQGHHVAMTGDGVNDLLALREADCSIAVSEGSDASRQISQIVLLDSDFTYLPEVVKEGRRTINHVTRTAGVFFIKTIYSVLVSLLCLFCNLPFPFIPIQITLIDACIEAYPAFFTIFEADTRKPKGSFLKSAMMRALPFALAITGMIGVFRLIEPFTVLERQTVMYLLLIIISMAAVVKSCVPFTKFRTFICMTMVFLTFGALVILPSLFGIVAL